MFAQAPSYMAVLEGPEHRFAQVNPAYARLVGGRDVLGKTIREALPDAVAQGYLDLLDSVIAAAWHTIRRARASSVASRRTRRRRAFPGLRLSTDHRRRRQGRRHLREASLRESEARYRALFEAIDEGVGILEPIGAGADTDFRLVAANPAFVATSGLDAPVGATLSELLGPEAPSWAAAFADVLASTATCRWRRRLEATGRILDVSAYRLDEGANARVGLLLNDGTARVQPETDRLALLRLADLIREADDPDDLSFEAAKVLGEALGVSRAGFDLLRRPDVPAGTPAQVHRHD